MKQKNASVWKAVRFLLGYVLRNRALAVICTVCVVLNSLCGIAAPYLLRPIINDYIPAGAAGKLVRAVILLGGIYLLGVLSAWVSARLMIRISQKTTRDIRNDLFARIQTLPVSSLDGKTHGDFMSCFTGDIETINDAVNTALNNILSGIITFVGVVTMMLLISPLLCLISACFLAAMYSLVRFSGSRSRFYFQRQQKQLGALNGYIQEIISGLKVVKVTGHEAQAVEGFQSHNRGLTESANAAQTFAGILMPALGGTASINTAVSLCAGAVFVILGWIDLGSLVAYSQYLSQAGRPVATISNQWNLILAATAGTERIMEVLSQEPEPVSGSVTLSEGSWRTDSGSVACRGAVEFRNVSFSYGETEVLHDISFTAEPGQKIALVGSTGAGKTTILSLLTRFYEPCGGQILLDGIPAGDIRLADLRSCFGAVLQDTHLFTDTVRENIRFGDPEADDAAVVRAAELASADFFLSHLPEGYDSMLSGDGGNLSAGQRQLIAIARGIIAGRPVLLLDEATASVDTWTEHQIEQGMDRLMEGRTVLIIAHRLSTVRNADCILVLEQGRILERGTHQELLDRKGRYYDLYTGAVELS
ncbi:MAG: ABC transporter ATP-binding protein [Oscillospiraceae bacterium]|nr:ABC transporter ATP-binding protein [Oscillospiraceae bacterium]